MAFEIEGRKAGKKSVICINQWTSAKLLADTRSIMCDAKRERGAQCWHLRIFVSFIDNRDEFRNPIFSSKFNSMMIFTTLNDFGILKWPEMAKNVVRNDTLGSNLSFHEKRQ